MSRFHIFTAAFLVACQPSMAPTDADTALDWSVVNPDMGAPPADAEVAASGPMVRGTTVPITVTLPMPLDNIALYLPTSDGGLGSGICPPALGGDCLGIVGALDLYGAASTTGGVATFDYVVDSTHPTDEVAFQAVGFVGGVAYLSEPVALPVFDDLDGDGVPASEDCDDDDPTSTVVATDADCDGVVTIDDCDDDDALVDCPSSACVDGVCVPTMEVYGQFDFFGWGANGAEPRADGLYYPYSLTKVGDTWVVVDSANNRLSLSSSDTLDDPELIVGQQSTTRGTYNGGQGGPEGWTMSYPTDACTDGERLVVVDAGNNRLLLWNQLPTHWDDAADVIIGQPDPWSGEQNQGRDEATSSTLSTPGACALHRGRLFVADYLNHRVVVYDTLPTVDGASADWAIGQPDLFSTEENRGGTTSALSLSFPMGVAVIGGRLLVSDSNNRVLVWNTVPTTYDVPADLAIGQPDLNSDEPGSGADQLHMPWSGVEVSGQLLISDMYNHRIVGWNSFPTQSGAPADVVIGQSDFALSQDNRGLDGAQANSLSYPSGLHADDGIVWVADYSNNRLVEFGPGPLATDASAITVAGQDDFTSSWPNKKGVDAFGFYGIGCFGVSSDQLMVCDRYNGRAMLLDKDASGAASVAQVAIGKPDFSSHCHGWEASCRVTTASDLSTPEGGTFGPDGALYISDRYNHRVLVYTTPPTSTGAPADFVIGQPDFLSGLANQGPQGAGWLNTPSGVRVHGDQLFVADAQNHRVLAYDLPITMNQPPATLVIGQPDFETLTRGLASDKLSEPMGVHVEGEQLFIVEYANNRVLVYDAIPTAHGASADHVIGQPDFLTAEQGTTADRFGGGMQIGALAIIDNFLFVPDRNNARVLGFDLGGLASGMAATAVLGQDDFETAVWTEGETAEVFSSLAFPSGILVDPDGEHIWLSESGAHRVVRIRKAAFWELVTMADGAVSP